MISNLIKRSNINNINKIIYSKRYFCKNSNNNNNNNNNINNNLNDINNNINIENSNSNNKDNDIVEITSENETIKYEIIIKEPIIPNQTIFSKKSLKDINQSLKIDKTIELGKDIDNESKIKVKSPINPFEYSIETVTDALTLPELKPVGLDNTYATGVMHENLKQSMPYLKKLSETPGEIENAFSLFQVMERFYVPIDEQCYKLLRKQIESAIIEIATFNEAIRQEELKPGSMPDERLYIPTVQTLNTLLNYYTETDKLSEAFRLFLTMKMLGVQPNQHTYRSLINASIRYEDIDVALLAYENMRSDGIRLEAQSYERLFESCCNTVHYDGASDLYRELVDNFKVSATNRMALLTTLGTTRLMGWLGVPRSTRSGRGWVTSLQVSPSRYIFPPKHENHILLEPQLPASILKSLSPKSNGGGLLPFS
ncbi:hypothetical protein ACTFIV_002039 [Dictyostelium citrinum]